MLIVGAFIVSCGNTTDHPNEHEHATAKGSAPAKIKPTPTRIEKGKQRGAAKCKRSLKCWADKNHAVATVLCKDAIEHKIGSAVKWTDGPLEQKFYRYEWADKAHHKLIYAGDHLQVQNLFGAWMNQKYYCIFNPETQKVAAVNNVFGKFKN